MLTRGINYSIPHFSLLPPPTRTPATLIKPTHHTASYHQRDRERPTHFPTHIQRAQEQARHGNFLKAITNYPKKSKSQNHYPKSIFIKTDFQLEAPFSIALALSLSGPSGTICFFITLGSRINRGDVCFFWTFWRPPDPYLDPPFIFSQNCCDPLRLFRPPVYSGPKST